MKTMGAVVKDAASDVVPMILLAHGEGAEAARGRAVHQDVGPAPEVAHVAFVDGPGQVPGGEVVERVDEAAFLRARRELDVHELDEEVVGPLHP
jgi:hypothetical protein